MAAVVTPDPVWRLVGHLLMHAPRVRTNQYGRGCRTCEEVCTTAGIHTPHFGDSNLHILA